MYAYSHIERIADDDLPETKAEKPVSTAVERRGDDISRRPSTSFVYKRTAFCAVTSMPRV